MTHTTLSHVLVSLFVSGLFYAVVASDHTGANQATTTSKEINTMVTDHSPAGKSMPMSADAHSKTPHAEKQVPQMEELPHIHKFHKERVKKIKKHHSKYWLLSQLLLALCHISILIIGFLHATH